MLAQSRYIKCDLTCEQKMALIATILSWRKEKDSPKTLTPENIEGRPYGRKRREGWWQQQTMYAVTSTYYSLLSFSIRVFPVKLDRIYCSIFCGVINSVSWSLWKDHRELGEGQCASVICRSKWNSVAPTSSVLESFNFIVYTLDVGQGHSHMKSVRKSEFLERKVETWAYISCRPTCLHPTLILPGPKGCTDPFQTQLEDGIQNGLLV